MAAGRDCHFVAALTVWPEAVESDDYEVFRNQPEERGGMNEPWRVEQLGSLQLALSSSLSFRDPGAS